MVYHARTKPGVDVLRLDGKLNAAQMVKVKTRVNRLISRNHKKFLFDMKRIRHVELAGLGILVDRLRQVRAQKGDIKFFNVRPEIEQTFRMIGVSGLMEAFSSEEEALRSFAA